MITNFSLFEAQQRHYEGGNVFSNNHRSPNLPAGCAMIDIDNLTVSGDKISSIIEEKGIFDSKFLGNPMSSSGTWQRTKLLDICKTLNCPLIFRETTTGTSYEFFGSDNPKKIEFNETPLDTSDRIYVEIRYGKPKAVMFRTGGSKIQDLPLDDIFNAALILSKHLNIRLYIINDIIADKIYIRKYFPLKDGEKEVTYLISPVNNQESWENTYSRMGLL